MTGLDILLNGEPVSLADQPLKSGGQAAVYPIQGRNRSVVKIYRESPGAEQERRLESMMKMAPLGGRPTHQSQPPELAWPTALARSLDGKFLGYSMPRFGEPQHVQLVGLFTRSVRLRLFPDRADWRFLLGVGWNLAFMTARMHHEQLVIGDFSSNNVVVDRDGFITFLDCDSIAFTDSATQEHFPCLMQTADYCSPERQRSGPATEASDDFALAVLVYQLLTGGNHPFGGVPRDSDSESTVKDNIASSRSYVVRPETIVVPRSVLDPTILPPPLLELARAAFGPGAEDPARRPKARDWLQALDRERAHVQVCAARPNHTYGSHLTACPWCARAATTGQDLFNPTPQPAMPPPLPAAQYGQQFPAFRPGVSPPARQDNRTALIIALVIGSLVLLILIAIAVGSA